MTGEQGSKSAMTGHPGTRRSQIRRRSASSALHAVRAQVSEWHVCCFVRFPFFLCWGEIVKGDEGPVSGVAQVVCHGVKVVGVHGEEGREEDDEV